jgi:hypothetical protein
MIEVSIFISGGNEIQELRDIAMKALRLLEQTFTAELDVPLVLRSWDFRIDPPRVVPRGALAVKSLTMVERSQAVVAILGQSVPGVTRQEILRAFELRANGVELNVWMFMRSGPQTDDHRELFQEIGDRWGEDIIFSQYEDQLDFQGKLLVTLMPYVLERVESAQGPLFGRV